MHIYMYTYIHTDMKICTYCKKFKQFEEIVYQEKYYCRKLLSVHRHSAKFPPLQMHLFTHRANCFKVLYADATPK